MADMWNIEVIFSSYRCSFFPFPNHLLKKMTTLLIFFMVYCLQIATRLFFEIAKNNISDTCSSKLELYHGNRMQPVNFHSAPTCKPLYLSVGVSVCLQKWQQRASNTSQVWHPQVIIKWWEIRKYVIQVYFNSILLILLIHNICKREKSNSSWQDHE